MPFYTGEEQEPKLPADQILDFNLDSSFSFRWLGVGGLEFNWQSTTLLVDPFLSRPILLPTPPPTLNPIKGYYEKTSPKRMQFSLLTHTMITS